MQKMEIEVLSFMVMPHPLRRFPGVLIQGDTLHSMKRRAERVVTSLNEDQDEETYYAMKDISDWLSDTLDHYSAMPEQHGFELPYPAPD